MVWEHLDINQPHLVYLVLGGFTTLFMLCSSVIKERFYIGEATVATICGIIFGPHGAKVIDPLQWGNTDQITLEFARIVLVVQCFAVGVELPRSYMERHWKSVVLLLVPVMTFGYFITSLFIWWLFMNRLDWLDSLCIAACVTATDPVLASSVVGKGKFAKRVPKHLRDLLSAESGCNDGMAFPFVYLAVYLIRYRPDANAVSLHWFCYTILYECVFGAVYGVIVGYLARRAIRYAHEHDIIDRESFLVFYFVLALFCAGSGSLLGMDDLLVGFAAGVGFSNDGWFQEKTEETHVSNVIDLLINLAFFVYFGTIIPWAQYNDDVLGIQPWKLVVLSIFVILFRRIPIMVALKPIIPDIKTWRESLFAGHFGPIGVGALFVAILARAELETETTTPLAVIPDPDFPHANIIELIWPITTFLVIVSIIIHGSSVAVFTLGKHINTLTLTLSYTQANEDGPSWMERLPRIQSRSKSSMSQNRPDDSDSLYDEKYSGPDGLPINMPGNFLRRQKEEDNPTRSGSRDRKSKKGRRRQQGMGPGGPISQSAIAPQRRRLEPEDSRTDSETLAASREDSPNKEKEREGSQEYSREHSRDGSGDRSDGPQEEIYQEGGEDIIEDKDGNVLEISQSRKGETPDERDHRLQKRASELEKEDHVYHGRAHREEDKQFDRPDGLEQVSSAIKEGIEHPASAWSGMVKRMGGGKGGLRRRESESGPSKKPEVPKPKRGPALAYQFGNTIIVEDEDGEVLKKYDIPVNKPARPEGLDRIQSSTQIPGRQALARMGTFLGIGGAGEAAHSGPTDDQQRKKYSEKAGGDDDQQIRFTIGQSGRRMSKLEFIEQIQRMDPKARAKVVENSDASEALKQEVRQDAREHHARVDAKQQQERRRKSESAQPSTTGRTDAEVKKISSNEDQPKGPSGLTLVDSHDQEIPFHDVHDDLKHHQFGQGSSGGSETAAQRRRRLASTHRDSSPKSQPVASPISENEDEDVTSPTSEEARRVQPAVRMASSYFSTGTSNHSRSAATDVYSDEDDDDEEEAETAAERRRREEVFRGTKDDSDSDEDDATNPSGFRDLTRTSTNRSARGGDAPAAAHAKQASSLATVQEASQLAGDNVARPERSYQGGGATASTSATTTTTATAPAASSSSPSNENPIPSPQNQRASIRFAEGVRGAPGSAPQSGRNSPTEENPPGNNSTNSDSRGGNSVRRSRLRWGDLVKKH